MKDITVKMHRTAIGTYQYVTEFTDWATAWRVAADVMDEIENHGGCVPPSVTLDGVTLIIEKAASPTREANIASRAFYKRLIMIALIRAREASLLIK